MSTYCCGTGALSKLAVGLSTGTPTRMDFIDFDPKIVKLLSNGGDRAIRGTLDPIDTDVAEGMFIVRFRTRFYLTGPKMDVLLPCLGFTESPTDTFTLGDSLTESTVVVGYAGSKEHTYSGCVPTDWVVSGQKGSDPVSIDIGWIGKTWATAAAGTFFTSQSSPAMTEGLVYPYGTGVNNTTSLTFNGSPVLMPQVRIALDYGIVDEYLNSTNLTNACPTKHNLTVATSALYSTCDGTEALFETPVAGTITGGAVVANFARTDGSNNQTRFTIANGKLLARPPLIKKNDFQRLPINIQGFATGSTPLLVVLNKAAEA